MKLMFGVSKSIICTPFGRLLMNRFLNWIVFQRKSSTSEGSSSGLADKNLTPFGFTSLCRIGFLLLFLAASFPSSWNSPAKPVFSIAFRTGWTTGWPGSLELRRATIFGSPFPVSGEE